MKSQSKTQLRRIAMEMIKVAGPLVTVQAIKKTMDLWDKLHREISLTNLNNTQKKA